MADSSGTIKDLYDEALKKQQDAINNAYASGSNMYGGIRSAGDNAYQGLDRQASIDKAMQDGVTASGDRAAGITAKAAPATISLRSANNLRNTLGKNERQHENFGRNVDLALGKLQTQNNEDKIRYSAQNASDRAAAQVSQSNFDNEYGLKKNEQDFNEAYTLFMNRKMGPKGFKNMTGIAVKALPKIQPLIIKLPSGYTGTASNRKGYVLRTGKNKDGTDAKYLVKEDLANEADNVGTSLFDENGFIKNDNKIIDDINAGISAHNKIEGIEGDIISKISPILNPDANNSKLVLNNRISGGDSGNKFSLDLDDARKYFNTGTEDIDSKYSGYSNNDLQNMIKEAQEQIDGAYKFNSNTNGMLQDVATDTVNKAQARIKEITTVINDRSKSNTTDESTLQSKMLFSGINNLNGNNESTGITDNNFYIIPQESKKYFTSSTVAASKYAKYSNSDLQNLLSEAQKQMDDASSYYKEIAPMLPDIASNNVKNAQAKIDEISGEIRRRRKNQISYINNLSMDQLKSFETGDINLARDADLYKYYKQNNIPTTGDYETDRETARAIITNNLKNTLQDPSLEDKGFEDIRSAITKYVSLVNKGTYSYDNSGDQPDADKRMFEAYDYLKTIPSPLFIMTQKENTEGIKSAGEAFTTGFVRGATLHTVDFIGSSGINPDYVKAEELRGADCNAIYKGEDGSYDTLSANEKASYGEYYHPLTLAAGDFMGSSLTLGATGKLVTGAAETFDAAKALGGIAEAGTEALGDIGALDDATETLSDLKSTAEAGNALKETGSMDETAQTLKGLQGPNETGKTTGDTSGALKEAGSLEGATKFETDPEVIKGLDGTTEVASKTLSPVSDDDLFLEYANSIKPDEMISLSDFAKIREEGGEAWNDLTLKKNFNDAVNSDEVSRFADFDEYKAAADYIKNKAPELADKYSGDINEAINDVTNKVHETGKTPEEVAEGIKGNIDSNKNVIDNVEKGTSKDTSKTNFNKYLRDRKGPPPEDMVDPHAHHILFKEGHGDAQKALVREGQELLERYGIDPVFGLEDLDWAPNRLAGQHGIGALRNVVEQLKMVEDFGGTYEYIRSNLIKRLSELGKLAARRS